MPVSSREIQAFQRQLTGLDAPWDDRASMARGFFLKNLADDRFQGLPPEAQDKVLERFALKVAGKPGFVDRAKDIGGTVLEAGRQAVGALTREHPAETGDDYADFEEAAAAPAIRRAQDLEPDDLVGMTGTVQQERDYIDARTSSADTARLMGLQGFQDKDGRFWLDHEGSGVSKDLGTLRELAKDNPLYQANEDGSIDLQVPNPLVTWLGIGGLFTARINPDGEIVPVPKGEPERKIYEAIKDDEVLMAMDKTFGQMATDKKDHLSRAVGNLYEGVKVAFPGQAGRAILEAAGVEPYHPDRGDIVANVAYGVGEFASFLGDMIVAGWIAPGIMGAGTQAGRMAAKRLGANYKTVDRAGRIVGGAHHLGVGALAHSANTRQSMDELRSTYLNSAAFGAAFSSVGTLFPKKSVADWAKRQVAGLITLDAVRSAQSGQMVAPWDERTIAEKTSAYLMDVYFLWRGHGGKLSKAEEAIIDQVFAKTPEQRLMLPPPPGGGAGGQIEGRPLFHGLPEPPRGEARIYQGMDLPAEGQTRLPPGSSRGFIESPDQVALQQTRQRGFEPGGLEEVARGHRGYEAPEDPQLARGQTPYRDDLLPAPEGGGFTLDGLNKQGLLAFAEANQIQLTKTQQRWGQAKLAGYLEAQYQVLSGRTFEGEVDLGTRTPVRPVAENRPRPGGRLPRSGPTAGTPLSPAVSTQDQAARDPGERLAAYDRSRVRALLRRGEEADVDLEEGGDAEAQLMERLGPLLERWNAAGETFPVGLKAQIEQVLESYGVPARGLKKDVLRELYTEYNRTTTLRDARQQQFHGGELTGDPVAQARQDLEEFPARRQARALAEPLPEGPRGTELERQEPTFDSAADLPEVDDTGPLDLQYLPDPQQLSDVEASKGRREGGDGEFLGFEKGTGPDWFSKNPEGFGREAAQTALRKAAAGEKLGVAQERFVRRAIEMNRRASEATPETIDATDLAIGDRVKIGGQDYQVVGERGGDLVLEGPDTITVEAFGGQLEIDRGSLVKGQGGSTASRKAAYDKARVRGLMKRGERTDPDLEETGDREEGADREGGAAGDERFADLSSAEEQVVDRFSVIDHIEQTGGSYRGLAAPLTTAEKAEYLRPVYEETNLRGASEALSDEQLVEEARALYDSVVETRRDREIDDTVDPVGKVRSELRDRKAKKPKLSFKKKGGLKVGDQVETTFEGQKYRGVVRKTEDGSLEVWDSERNAGWAIGVWPWKKQKGKDLEAPKKKTTDDLAREIAEEEALEDGGIQRDLFAGEDLVGKKPQEGTDDLALFSGAPEKSPAGKIAAKKDQAKRQLSFDNQPKPKETITRVGLVTRIHVAKAKAKKVEQSAGEILASELKMRDMDILKETLGEFEVQVATWKKQRNNKDAAQLDSLAQVLRDVLKIKAGKAPTNTQEAARDPLASATQEVLEARLAKRRQERLDRDLHAKVQAGEVGTRPSDQVVDEFDATKAEMDQILEEQDQAIKRHREEIASAMRGEDLNLAERLVAARRERTGQKPPPGELTFSQMMARQNVAETKANVELLERQIPEIEASIERSKTLDGSEPFRAQLEQELKDVKEQLTEARQEHRKAQDEYKASGAGQGDLFGTKLRSGLLGGKGEERRRIALDTDRKGRKTRKSTKGAGNEYIERKPEAELSEARKERVSQSAGREDALQRISLDAVRVAGQQEITNIREAQDWLQANGFPKIAPAGETARTIERLLKTPAFQKLSTFDQIRVAAQLERPIRERDYNQNTAPRGNSKLEGTQVSVQSGQNRKVAGGRILAGDTVKGCDNFCFECYGLKGSQQGQISHQHPVLADLGGLLHTGDLFRNGEVGDPSKNWGHTHRQVEALIARSVDAGHQVTARDNVFHITKLLDLGGFNPETARNLQVTLDPMFPAHMKRSMENILRLKSAYPEVNVTARIRSMHTTNPDLVASQEIAVDFAERWGLPIIDTRMRFLRNSSAELLGLDLSKYKREGNQLKPTSSPLRKIKRNTKICDSKGGGCPECGACVSVIVGRAGHLGQQNARVMAEGIDGVPLEELDRYDSTGGTTLFSGLLGHEEAYRARRERARAIGFDTKRTWYHGTEKDFTRFSSEESYRDSGAWPSFGFHFGSTARAANDRVNDIGDSQELPLAYPYGANVMPVWLRYDNPVRLGDSGFDNPRKILGELMQDHRDLFPYDIYNPTFERWGAEWEAIWAAKPERTRVLDETALVSGQAYAATTGEYDKWRANWGRMRQRQEREFIDILDEVGVDAIEYENEVEDPGSIAAIVWHPEQIRSVHAEFDPKKASSDYILGSGILGREPKGRGIFLRSGIFGWSWERGRDKAEKKGPKGWRQVEDELVKAALTKEYALERQLFSDSLLNRLTHGEAQRTEPEATTTATGLFSRHLGLKDLVELGSVIQRKEDRQELGKAIGSVHKRRGLVRFAKKGESKESLALDAWDEAARIALEIRRTGDLKSEDGMPLDGLADAKETVKLLREGGKRGEKRDNEDLARLIEMGIEIQEGKHPKVSRYVDRISGELSDLGLESEDAGLISRALTNYSPRYWDHRGTPNHGKHRTLDESGRGGFFGGIRAGYRQRIRGLSNVRAQLIVDTGNRLASRELVEMAITAKDADGRPIFSTSHQKGEYTLLESPAFKKWQPIFSLNLAPLVDGLELAGDWGFQRGVPQGLDYIKAVDGQLGERIEKALADKKKGTSDVFITQQGDKIMVWQRRDLYAPNVWARHLNKIGKQSVFRDPGAAPYYRAGGKILNALYTMKATLLSYSLFHHQAVSRSYLFGNRPWETGDTIRPWTAARQGYQMASALEGTILRGVRNGLTLWKTPEWDPKQLGQRRKLTLGKGSPASWAGKAREEAANSLFERFQTGLKAKAFDIEYRRGIDEWYRENPRKEITDEVLDKIAMAKAQVINADFGGLHWSRIGRSQTILDLERFVLLAPDWTESNLRYVPLVERLANRITREGLLMAEGGRNTAKGPETGIQGMDQTYLRFFAGAMAYATLSTILANLAINGWDETVRLFGKNIKEVSRTGKATKLLENPAITVDLTKVWKHLGMQTHGRRIGLRTAGQFADPLKMMLGVSEDIWPTKFFKHKSGIGLTALMDGFYGTNWADRPYLKWQDAIRYGHITQPRQGKQYEKRRDYFPTWLFDQVTGVAPIPMQTVMEWQLGEVDGLTALMRAAGAPIHEAYPTKPRKPKRPLRWKD